MEIEMTLDVPAEHFFARLVESALYDIHQQTDQTLNAKQLPRFSYRKRFANGTFGRLTVTDYLPAGVYAYTIDTGRNRYEVGYEVQSVGTQTQLHYTEQVIGANGTVNANNKLTAAALGWLRKRRFKKMAQAMAQDGETRSSDLS
jgi:hypothetical protein